jgi:hypothetical protein
LKLEWIESEYVERSLSENNEIEAWRKRIRDWCLNNLNLNVERSLSEDNKIESAYFLDWSFKRSSSEWMNKYADFRSLNEAWLGRNERENEFLNKKGIEIFRRVLARVFIIYLFIEYINELALIFGYSTLYFQGWLKVAL